MARRKQQSYHISEIEDCAIRWLRDELAGTGDQFPLFERVEGRVYVSVNTLASLARRSRQVVNRSVDRRWADAAAMRGLGTPVRPDVFEELVERAQLDLGDVFGAIERSSCATPPKRATYPERVARQALLAEAQRLLAGEPTALAHERGHVRFSSGDAAEHAGEHHVRVAHGIKNLGLWVSDAGWHEYAALRRKLGRPIDAARLIEILRAEGVDVEPVARRLLEIRGERERAKLPGRQPPPDRTGARACRDDQPKPRRPRGTPTWEQHQIDAELERALSARNRKAQDPLQP